MGENKLLNIEELEKKWNTLVNGFYVCYSIVELASKVVYEMFDLDILNDVHAYYMFNGEHKYFKFIVNIQKNKYFIFRIQWVNSMFGDNGLKIFAPELKTTEDKIPKNYKDVWELVDND